jgi:hypothetical protein
VADPEYARLNTGVSITRGNSGNGALPTRGSEQAENKRGVGQITDARTRRPPFGNDHLHTPAVLAVWQTQSRDDNESRVTSLPARQLYRSSDVGTAQRQG